MTEDRYLDSSRRVHEWEEANRPGGALDDEAVLEELAKAVKHCDVEGKRHQDVADAYILARAAYFAEAHRRTVISRRECGVMGKFGYTKPLSGREGFHHFCHRTGVDQVYANRMVAIANSSDPVLALETLRHKAKMRQRRSRETDAQAALAVGLIKGPGATARDPLFRTKREWQKLSPLQRLAFLKWAGYSNLDPIAGAEEWVKSNPLRMAAE